MQPPKNMLEEKEDLELSKKFRIDPSQQIPIIAQPINNNSDHTVINYLISIGATDVELLCPGFISAVVSQSEIPNLINIATVEIKHLKKMTVKESSVPKLINYQVYYNGDYTGVVRSHVGNIKTDALVHIQNIEMYNNSKIDETLITFDDVNSDKFNHF